MMKTAFRKLQRPAVSFLSVMSLVMPLSVSAAFPSTVGSQNREERVNAMQEERGERMEEMKGRMQEAFCNRFTETASSIGSGMASARRNFEERAGERGGQMDEGRDSRDSKLEDSRSDADAKRSEMYARLEEQADTDAKKEAIEDFQKTVEEAVDDRRDAVNAALTAFRAGVDTLLASRKDDMQSAADTFAAAMKSALEKAKSDCEAGTAPATVRSNFQAALTAAHKALQTDRAESDKIRTEIQALADTRHAAIEKAMSDFKATVEAAAKELREAMGEAKA